MQENITSRFISALKPKAKPFEVWDTNLSGLILRVEPTGAMTYYLQYRRTSDRKRVRIRLGKASVLVPHQARDLAKAQLADVYKGEDPVEKKKKARANNYVAFVEETYKPWLLSHLRTGQARYEMLVRSFPEFHSLSLEEVTPLHLEKWRRRRQDDGVKPTTINRELADLKAMLNRAAEWGVIESNPVAAVKPSKIDSSPKVRYLTREEKQRLWQALDEREEALRMDRENANSWREERGYPLYADLRSCAFADHLKPAVLLSLFTGLRRGELMRLQWENVDFEKGLLTVTADTTKAGKTRHLPLSETAKDVLRKWKQQPGIKSAVVFPGPDGRPMHDMDTAWTGVLKRAKIANFRWHDLRHSFASELVMSGVDLNTVRELMGHSDYKMTLRYAHLAPEHKAAAVAKLDEAFNG